MNDSISRKWLIECVEEGWIKFDTEKDKNKFIHLVRDTAPSAEEHGKWIKAQPKGIISYSNGYAECNKCHEVSYLGWNDKYCRNCGKRMDGE